MDRMFKWIIECIVHVIYWDSIDKDLFSWPKFLWGLLFVFLIGSLCVTVWYKVYDNSVCKENEKDIHSLAFRLLLALQKLSPEDSLRKRLNR